MSYIKYKKPSLEEFKAFSSETEKYRHLTAPYCTGCGVDIASQGVNVVPWAIAFDLPKDEFSKYANGIPPKGPIHLRGHANKLPFDSNSLDWVYCSHLLEDFPKEKRGDYIAEFARVCRQGGHIIILVPEVTRWNHAIYNLGQPPNCAHCAPEPSLGDMTEIAKKLGLTVIREELTNCYPDDYSILAVLKK